LAFSGYDNVFIDHRYIQDETMRKLLLAIFSLALLFPLSSYSQWKEWNPVVSYQQQPDAVMLKMKQGTLRLQPLTESILRVTYSATGTIPEQTEYVVIKKQWPAVKFSVASDDKEIALATSKLKVVVSKVDGAIAYKDSSGKQLMLEGTRMLTPAVVNGEKTYKAESFLNVYGSPEGLYGLGQHQAGVWNYRGESVDVSQENSNIAVPLLVSSNGYGLFWN